MLYNNGLPVCFCFLFLRSSGLFNMHSFIEMWCWSNQKYEQSKWKRFLSDGSSNWRQVSQVQWLLSALARIYLRVLCLETCTRDCKYTIYLSKNWTNLFKFFQYLCIMIPKRLMHYGKIQCCVVFFCLILVDIVSKFVTLIQC